MSLAFNGSLNPEVGFPQEPLTEDHESSLNIAVIFTSTTATIAALTRAGSLAQSLGAKVTLLVPQIVPFPLPLESPPVLLEFQEKRFRELASASPVEIQVQLYLCRNELETLKTVLRPHSLIVMGGPRRFWPTREKSLAKKLHRRGHEVIFAEME